MMPIHLNVDDYEIAAFFGLIAAFEVAERIWPAHPLDRWRDLKLDVLSFAFALAANRFCTHWIRAWVNGGTPVVVHGTVVRIQHLPSVVKLIMALFVADFVIYWIHRAQHSFDVFWRTHAWHHSIEEMYWFAGFRTSFLHSLIYNIPQVFIPVTVCQLSPAEAAVGYSIGLLVQFWEHTNIRVNLGWLERVIVTPDYHRIHHSATIHRGKNLGAIFRIWDQLFGTYVDPRLVPEAFPLGLGDKFSGRQIPRMFLGI